MNYSEQYTVCEVTSWNWRNETSRILKNHVYGDNEKSLCGRVDLADDHLTCDGGYGLVECKSCEKAFEKIKQQEAKERT